MLRINTLAILCVLVHTAFGKSVFLVTKTVPMDTTDSCPPGYQQPANSNWTMCFKIQTDYKNKFQAAQQCLTFSNGTLVSVPNSFVNSYLYSLASRSYATSLWLGITCMSNFNGTTCVNDDGTPFVYNNFNQGQPNPAEQCVYLSAIGRDSQYWSTFDCNQGFAYACQAPFQPPQAPLRCPKGYDEFNGTCYKYVDISPEDQITGNSATTLCTLSAPGGNLATIGSAQLNQFLISKQDGQNSYTAFGLICPVVKADGDRSSCYWEDGTTYGYYNAFSDIDTPAQYYGGGCCDFNKGVWANCWPCDETRFDSYICEAPMQRY